MDRYEKTILKINKGTINGTYSWTRTSLSMESIVPNAVQLGPNYTSKIDGSSFLLGNYKVKHFYDEDSYEWNEVCELFLIVDGAPTFLFKKYDLVKDLYNSVTLKTSGIIDFMANFLGEDNKDDNEFEMPF